jgi:pectinesterase
MPEDGSGGALPRLRVDPSGGGDALSLGQALARLPDPPQEGGAFISLEPGSYREKNIVSYPGLRIAGAGMDSTRIVWGDYARMLDKGGLAIRTFASYTLLLAANGIELADLSIENDSGWGDAIGQAVALYADADLLRIERCRIASRQDSLFLGPLPPTPLEGKDFGGPRDGLPRRTGRQLYRDCRIEGDVDFIFGSAQALFWNCGIVSLHRPGSEGVQGYVAAPSTQEGSSAGFLFSECSFEAETGLPDQSVYLARPWRDHARAVFHRCWIGRHVKKELWDDWGKEAAREQSFFACVDCRGEGMGKDRIRLPWEKALSREGLDANYSLFEAAFPGLRPLS